MKSSSYPTLHCQEKDCACGIGIPFQDILEALLVTRQVYPALPLRATPLPDSA